MRPFRRTPDRRARLARTAVGVCALLLSTGVGATAPASATPVAHEKGLKTWWYSALNLEAAHRETTGKGVKIAVIDEAIDPTAPELRGANVTLGKDCRGDRVKKATELKADHGTAVTTLISGTGKGTGPGGLGIRGVAPGAQVTFYATDPDPSDALVNCYSLVDTSELVKYAMEGDPDIITTALGLGYDNSMRRVLKEAVDRGIVVVGATGDRRRPSNKNFAMEFPAGHPGAIGVDAGGQDGKAWEFNPPPVHSFVDANPVITAPGVDVTGIRWVPGQGWQSGQSRTGTSDAAPIVAGALALVKSKYPDATGNQLIQQLIHYTSSGTYAWDRTYGFGLLSMTKLLANDPTEWPDVNPLLNGPRRALKDYPMSIRDGAASTDPSSAATPSKTTSPSAGATTTDDTTPAAASTDDGGIPVWVWPLGVVVLLGVAGAGIAANKRGSRSSTSGRTERKAD
jgi:subtilisin family serine protease